MGNVVFVTGGSGFVGAGIVRALVKAGHRVRALARSEASAKAVAALGAEPVRGDLGDGASLVAGMRGASVVVHAAASLTEGGGYEAQAQTNVQGTKLVLDSARAAAVKRFIYISAASVVIDADRPTTGDERLPVPHHRSMPYSATKGVAEKLVLDASDAQMSTIALRPPFVWGEHAPAIELMADAFRKGQFMWIAGGTFRVSVVHVDNLASAVVRAIDHGTGAYFVTDDEVTPFRDFITAMLEHAGHQAKARSVSYGLASFLARVMGLFAAIFRTKEPPLTLERVRMMGQTLELSSDKAKRELGYAPIVTRAQGLARIRAAS